LASRGTTGDKKEGQRYDQGEIRHFVILPLNSHFNSCACSKLTSTAPHESNSRIAPSKIEDWGARPHVFHFEQTFHTQRASLWKQSV
jgi:hypothetical protein